MAEYTGDTYSMKNIFGGQTFNFSDGTCIEWVDRETIKYQEEERYTLIWVDYAPGFFSSGRILKASSIEYWQYVDGKPKEKISVESRKNIITKVIQYYVKQGKICKVEY